MNNNRFLNNEKTFSPAEVRKLLCSDNKEIQQLCKEVNVFPKKDSSNGRIFFFKSDVEVLQKVKDLYNKSRNTEKQIKHKENTALIIQEATATLSTEVSDSNAIINTVVDAKEDIIKKLTGIIDEKLDGIDDVVVELIKTKVENERLNQKVDQLTKENYKLSREVGQFKPIVPGLYKKTKNI